MNRKSQHLVLALFFYPISMNDFSHLHVHTTYSFLDGAARVDKMVLRAREHGFQSLAITDHGFIHGWPEFQIACEKEGVKPILGVEAYIIDSLPQTYADKDGKDKALKTEANKQLRSPCHQLLLAMTDEGVGNITKLVSRAASNHMHYRRPVIDLAMLKEHAEGVIATSSCMSGLIPKAIRNGDEEAVARYIRWFKDTFGDRFYFEVHNHGIEEEKVIRDAIVDLSRKHDVPVICANDVHYIDKDDYEVQKSLVQIAMGRTVGDGKEEYAHKGLHLASTEEMEILFGQQFPKSLDETVRLSERCSGSLPFGRDYVLPTIHAPEGYQDAFDYVAKLCEMELPNRYPSPLDYAPAKERLNYELNTLRKMQAERGIDFASYFLITSDMTSQARNSGIWVGPGRGSAAGSIVSYLLGITNIDPMRFGLLFERFLNPERVSMPDIDIDFQDSRRDEVFQYLRQKYGEESVMRIVTFSRIGSKSVVRDVARILSVPIAESNRLSEKVPTNPGEKEFSVDFMNDPYVVEKANTDERIAKIVSMGPRMFGLSKQTGMHACGVVVTPGPVTDFMPICRVKARGDKGAGELVTQFEGQHIESLGLLKLDVLGLSTGTIIQDTIELIRSTRGIEVDVDRINYDDSATFALFQKGETDGVFQFESAAMKDWLIKLKPDKLEDLIAMNALYRPGPMKLIPDYIARKHGEEHVVYPHPALSSALEETYGVAVYQEQVMLMARILAGFSLGEADLLRKAIGKKKPKEMAEMQDKFVKGCKTVRQIPQHHAEELFELIKEFVGYGFNKSHAAAYALIAYQTGYLKANFPVEFMTVTVQHNAGNAEEKTKYLQSCQNMGISILPPLVNESEAGFSPNHVKRTIFYGLGTVKGVGDAATSMIIQERKTNGPFTSFANFIERITLDPDSRITTGDIGSLIRVGAFDDLGERNALLLEMDSLMTWARKVRDYERGKSNQDSGKAWGTHRKSRPDPPDEIVIAPAPMSFEEKLRFEMQLLGQFISGHPMEGFDSVIPLIKYITGATPNVTPEEYFQVGYKKMRSLVGYIVSTVEKKTKRGQNAGQAFLVVTLLVGNQMVEVVAWNDEYNRFAFLLQPDERVWILVNDRGYSTSVEAVIDLKEFISDWSCGLRLTLDENRSVSELEESFGFSAGNHWTLVNQNGAVMRGPDIALSPEKLRKISQFGSVSIY